MIASLRTLEVLLLLAAVGVPISVLLRTRSGSGCAATDCAVLDLLEAPGLGLAILTVGASLVLATGSAVAAPWVVVSFWGLVAAAWGILIWRLRRGDAPRVSFVPRFGWLRCMEIGGLVLAVGLYLWPFLVDNRLEFWDYAGTDGYFYMRIAEHFGDYGTAVMPQVGTFEAASGLLSEEVGKFNAQTVVDKPGTMASLALLSRLLGFLPHQMFSPLNCASIALLYASLISYARAVAIPRWAAPWFALLVAAAVPTWFLASHTFLGNTLSLYLFPLVIVWLGRADSPRLAIYTGLLLAGQILLFPDGSLALLGMAAGPVALRLWSAWRSGTLRRVVLAMVVTLATVAALTAPLARGLFRAVLLRLADMRVAGGGVDTAVAVPGLQLGRALPNFDWIWGALNLGMMPPEALPAAEAPALWLLGAILAAVLAGFLAPLLWRRRLDALGFELLAYVCLLVIGLGGIFQTGYELFRALAVFAFVPLAVIVRQLAESITPFDKPRLTVQSAARLAGAAVSFVLVARFVVTDYEQFVLGFDNHFADAQYTTADIAARAQMPSTIGSRRLVLGSESPSFTAFANVLMLFSSVPLGVPTSFYPFVFFGQNIPPAGAQYSAELVLINRRYGDIGSGKAVPIFATDDFAVVDNDLFPFFDNATFPALHAYPLEFLQRRNLPVVRVLEQPTEVSFFSRVPRQIRLTIKFHQQVAAPPEVTVQLDDLGGRVRVDGGGAAETPPMQVAAGLHSVRLGPLSAPAWVAQLGIEAIAN